MDENTKSVSKREMTQIKIVIKRLGGVCAVAKLLQCKHPAVSRWPHTGIPKARLMYLRVVRPDAFEGTRWERKAEPQEA